MERKPKSLRLPTGRAYDRAYWDLIDKTARLPKHVEIGLNGTHRITSYRDPWWRQYWRERSPWIDVAFFVLVVGALIAAIFIAGGKLELGT